MDVWTDGKIEFLSILQGFFPAWGRYPATLCDFTTLKKQGKGTIDLMMPFGTWFENVFCTIAIIFSQHVKLTQN